LIDSELGPRHVRRENRREVGVEKPWPLLELARSNSRASKQKLEENFHRRSRTRTTFKDDLREIIGASK
jgi:hypothetical protein